MTDPFWVALEQRTLPTEAVPMPREGGGTVSVVLRALPPVEWTALCEAFPAQGPDAQPGDVDLTAMRPTLLARSIVAPDGSPPRDPAWWEALEKDGGYTAGELEGLAWRAWQLNRRGSPFDLDAAGKG